MNKLRVVLCVAIWLGAVCGPSAMAETQPPAEGAILPEIRLPAPKDADGTYLGVSTNQEFSVADIAAEVVLIEIFNMY